MSRNSKTAIITGGAQGIGKAIAKAFLEKGWTAVIADTDREAGEETVREFNILGRIEYIQTDVSNEEQVEKLVELTIKQFERIDALINNAGIAVNKPLETLSLEEWNRVLGINLTGTFLCAKHSSPHLQRNGGSIINIASTRAFMSEASTEAYSASKGGVVALTHALAVSLGPGIRVNCISPIGGIRISLTKEVTIFPKATPMMIPTAMSTTFPRSANSLNSFNISFSSQESVM
jgi:NAD(P)-dependent dehydrogenase (short-subunit alcohol dehydrogenase family)